MQLSSDAFIQNAIVAGAAFVLLLLVAQLIMALVLRYSTRLLRWSVLQVPEASRDAWQRQVRRTVLLLVSLLGLGLVGGWLSLSWRHLYAGRWLLERARGLHASDLVPIEMGALKTVGISLAAVIVYFLLSRLIAFMTRRLETATWLDQRRAQVAELLTRLRLAVRWLFTFGALVTIARTLGVPESAEHVLLEVAYVFAAVYLSRFVATLAQLLVDVIFDRSSALAKLESPIKYLGRFAHIAGLTKRTLDYFIYVSAATWTSDMLTPDTWASRAGRVGIRIIAIFYISRVMIEVCQLFITELFLTRRPEHSEIEFQQRQTLMPVAAGFLRYAVYFSALVMVLREAGIDPTPLLAGAGILGIALGLGAQVFVGDIVAGFFILFENLVLVGDLVRVGDIKGIVEEIGVRVTKIRDEAGVLHAIPNGELRKVANHSRVYVNAVVDIAVPVGENLTRVLGLLRARSLALREAEAAILSDAEFKVHELKDAFVIVRSSTRVKPGLDGEITDRLRSDFFETMKAAGIAPPPPTRRVLLTRTDGSP